MSDNRRGRRGRQRPLEMRSDASLSEYFSFFWSLPARRNSTVSWEEAQYLDNDKSTLGDCDNEQDIETSWDSNRIEKTMADQAVVTVNEDKPSFTAIPTRFSGVDAENGNGSHTGLLCGRLFPETSSHSLSSGSIGPTSGSLDNHANANNDFHDAKLAVKMNSNGAKQLCVICGGLANGYHFGALSCAACNAFFRRSVAESRKYFCRKSGRCVIDQAARCFCRACRLKKCLECGMDPNAVQPHRDMIGQKRKRSLSDNRADSVNSGISLETSSSGGMKTPKKDDLIKSTEPTTDTSSKSVIDDRLPRNIIAESLIAFSRTPLISPLYNNASNSKLNGNLISQSNSDDKAEVSHDISASKLTTHVPLADTSVKSYGQSPLSPSLIDGVETPKNFNSDWFSSCLNQPNSGSQFPSTSTNDVPSSSAEWSQGTESSNIFWSTPVVNATVATLTSAVASTTQYGKIRSPSMPMSDYDPSKNTIEVLVDAYRRLRERRRLLFCPPTLRDMLGGTEAPLRSVPLGSPFQSLVRMDAGLLIEFFNMVHPFPKLRLDDRIKLVKNAGIAYSLLEKFYVTVRGGGFQTNRVINNDNSYHDLTLSDEEGDEQQNEELPFADGVDGDKKSKPDYRTTKRLLLPQLRDSMRDIAGGMYHSGITDAEFVALAVIILLDHTTPNLSDLARRLVKEERDHLYLDWFAYYEAHNISDGPQRVTSKKQAESYYLVRLFNLFEITSLVDDIMK
uniref:Nuclear receptor domain-containing protein n=1 Tax=Syphacia muris TaxID=451379 RepID=A0A158R4R4_9BILA